MRKSELVPLVYSRLGFKAHIKILIESKDVRSQLPVLRSNRTSSYRKIAGCSSRMKRLQKIRISCFSKQRAKLTTGAYKISQRVP